MPSSTCTTETTKPTVLDTHDSARYIGMSASFLKKARVEGNLAGRTPGPQYLKIGKAVRYRISDLDVWLNAHRQGC